VAELQQVPRRLMGAALVVDVDRGMARRTVGIHEHGRDADAIEDLQSSIVGRQADADEPVH